jgi:hypothetical protein
MGRGTFDPSAYRSFAASTSGKTTEEIYTSRGMNKLLDPKGVSIRESVDSDEHPNSTPIIIALDVTGSMGILADTIARTGLGVLFNSILDRKPVPDPHIMFMAVGDANFDTAPLQVSQFEADDCIIEQLTQIFIEHGGGGNHFESYNLPWYFAANHTVHDSLIKRGKRGYLFTVGDEEAPEDLTKAQIEHFIGDTLQTEMSTKEMLDDALRMYDVHHIIIEEGYHASRALKTVQLSWRELLGQKVISLSDHQVLAETIVSTIEIAEGEVHSTSVSHWGDKASTVLKATKHLPSGSNAPRLDPPPTP